MVGRNMFRPPVFLPCPVTTGYQQSEPANVVDVGRG